MLFCRFWWKALKQKKSGSFCAILNYSVSFCAMGPSEIAAEKGPFRVVIFAQNSQKSPCFCRKIYQKNKKSLKVTFPFLFLAKVILSDFLFFFGKNRQNTPLNLYETPPSSFYSNMNSCRFIVNIYLIPGRGNEV